MMVAIYRDNPGAFAKNMNAMLRGAVLRLPHAAELAAISAEDADREYSAQMTAWKGPKHSNPPRIRAAVADATNASVRENAEAEAAAESTIALTRRIQALEESLRRGREELNKPLPVPAAQPSETEVKVPSLDEEAPAPMWKFGIPWEAVVGGCLLVLALGVGLLLRGRRPSKSPEPFPFSEEHDDLAVDDLKALALQRAGFDNDQSLPNAKVSTARTDVDGGEKPVAPVSVSKPVSAAPKTGRSGDTTVVLAVTDSKYDETVELTLSGFNPEETINTMHVTMPDSLQDEKPSVERRKNPAEVLRQALEREPMRSDLRLKLLELYYIAAAQNRQAFLEIAHQLADNINLVSPREWLQIVEMGRKIASDDPLFAEERDDQAVA
jgi:pilus assembly protein FimV